MDILLNEAERLILEARKMSEKANEDIQELQNSLELYNKGIECFMKLCADNELPAAAKEQAEMTLNSLFIEAETLQINIKAIKADQKVSVPITAGHKNWYGLTSPKTSVPSGGTFDDILANTATKPSVRKPMNTDRPLWMSPSSLSSTSSSSSNFARPLGDAKAAIGGRAAADGAQRKPLAVESNPSSGGKKKNPATPHHSRHVTSDTPRTMGAQRVLLLYH